MPQVNWPVSLDGAYRIDVAVGSQKVAALVDLGMIDHQQRIGASIEAPVFDRMKQAGEFSHFFTDLRLDASGGITPRENGQVTAQLLSPVTGQGIGPIVALYVSRGVPGIPHRVGVVFFHSLVGCRVLWELNLRTWTVEYP